MLEMPAALSGPLLRLPGFCCEGIVRFFTLIPYSPPLFFLENPVALIQYCTIHKLNLESSTCEHHVMLFLSHISATKKFNLKDLLQCHQATKLFQLWYLQLFYSIPDVFLMHVYVHVCSYAIVRISQLQAS